MNGSNPPAAGAVTDSSVRRRGLWMAVARRWEFAPFHPFLFGAYPVVALAAANLGEMPLGDASRALVTVLAASMALLLLLRLFLRDGWRAALLTSAVLLLFFSYGHIYQALKTTEVDGIVLGRHRFIVPLFITLLAMVGGLALQRRISLRGATPILNGVSLVAVLLPCVMIGSDAIGPGGANPITSSLPPEVNPNAPSNADLPDVYYIIVDAYARSDVYRERFGYDNSEFMRFLKDRSFYVADQSRPNYLWTKLSLSSSLNLDYLQAIEPNLPGGGIRLERSRLIKDSLVRRRLQALHYATVGFITDWFWIELYDSDFMMRPETPGKGVVRPVVQMNALEGMLLNDSAAMVLNDLESVQTGVLSRNISASIEDPFEVHRNAILGVLENLKQVPLLPGRKFVFAHINSPHTPYLFGPNGETIANEGAFTLADVEAVPVDKRMGLFTEQSKFITAKMEESIDAILQRSERPVVIILQSDHGPSAGLDWRRPDAASLNARAAILNAYDVPEECRKRLYPTIAPVNTFRVLFDCLYGDRFPILPDKTYFGDDEKLVPIEDVLH